MQYFKISEFDDYSKMSPRLLCALDDFRHVLKSPVYLSPSPSAQWRDDGSTSLHNINKNEQKQSSAIDIFPTCTMWYAFLAALQVPTIKGIGLYPHWTYGKLNYGMHLDIRSSLNPVIWWRNKDNEYQTIHSLDMFREVINEYLLN